MRRSKLIFFSLALNFVLLAVVLWQSQLLQQRKGPTNISTGAAGSPKITSATSQLHSSSAAGNPAASENPARALANRISEARQNSQAPSPSSITNKPAPTWRSVESEDYRTYVKNLRDIGCPPQTIQDIVSADVLQAFAAKRAEAAAARYRDFKYWQTGSEEDATRQEFQRQRRVLDEEMDGVLRELLGKDFVSPPSDHEWKEAALDQQLGFLPESKREQAKAILLRYVDTDQTTQLLSDFNHRSPENSDERRHIIEAYEAKRNALSQLLSPDEYDRLDMTVSWTADNLRRAMAKFHPTEEEFSAIFRAWRAHDENLAHLYAKGEADPGNDHVYAKIRETLGETRFQQYKETWWK